MIDKEVNNKYEELIFEEEFTLDNKTPRELDEIADMILKADVRAGNRIHFENPILFQEHLRTRYKREIYNKEGVPDPSIEAGIYNRTHPQGRKVNSEKARKESGASYYR